MIITKMSMIVETFDFFLFLRTKYICGNYCLADNYICCGCNSPALGENLDPNKLCVTCPQNNKVLDFFKTKEEN